MAFHLPDVSDILMCVNSFGCVTDLFMQDRLQQLVSDYISKTESVKMLRCLSTRLESPDVMTFEFELRRAEDTEEGNVFADPGQFASFDFTDIRPGETINRTWTISSPQYHMAEHGTFTITVKKVGSENV